MSVQVHVLGTTWQDGAPALLVDADGPALLRPQGPLEWRVEGARTCTGTHRDGAWRPCAGRSEVGPESQCLACFRGQGDPERARDEPGCVFEPRCRDGGACACSFGRAAGAVPHVVYLAFHGVLPKVGMTRVDRVATRLREQGADAWFTVHPCADRAEARDVERRAAFLHGIPEWRTHKETLPQLSRPVPWRAIEERAAGLAEALAERFDVDPRLHRVEHALPQPLPGRPRRVPCEGLHRGTWLGGKGNHLVYAEAPRPDRLDLGGSPPLAAIKRAELHGLRITVAPETELEPLD